MKIHDRVFQRIVRKYGFKNALRFAKNIGIEFEDVYFMVFGRLPSVA